jgi:hypothetical protein
LQKLRDKARDIFTVVILADDFVRYLAAKIFPEVRACGLKQNQNAFPTIREHEQLIRILPVEIENHQVDNHIVQDRHDIVQISGHPNIVT